MSVYLRTEDLSQYARIMASISDTPGVVSKLTQMADRLDEQNERIKRLEAAGDELTESSHSADDDIREHLQVANYNLHGLLNTGERITPPNPPKTVHQAGIDASVRVREKLRAARLAWKAAKEAKP